jgi:hypothetical protein
VSIKPNYGIILTEKFIEAFSGNKILKVGSRKREAKRTTVWLLKSI